MIRVIVADDHPLMRQGIAHVLQAAVGIDVVAEAADGLEVLTHAALASTDVLLLDLDMPRLGGIGVLHALSERARAPHVLVLTAHSDDRIADAIDAGANGCILKDAAPAEIVEAVRATAAGRSVLTDAAAAAVVHAHRMEGSGLSRREIAVLRLVEQGLTNRAIGGTLAISEATVKTHLQNVYAKIEARDRTHAVTILRERGLL